MVVRGEGNGIEAGPRSMHRAPTEDPPARFLHGLESSWSRGIAGGTDARGFRDRPFPDPPLWRVRRARGASPGGAARCGGTRCLPAHRSHADPRIPRLWHRRPRAGADPVQGEGDAARAPAAPDPRAPLLRRRHGAAGTRRRRGRRLIARRARMTLHAFRASPRRRLRRCCEGPARIDRSRVACTSLPRRHAIAMFLAFVALTMGITYWAAGRTKSASDFYTAGGGITGFQNGLAIAGDYMSAATLLGLTAMTSPTSST